MLNDELKNHKLKKGENQANSSKSPKPIVLDLKYK
jgi:hypothetical protein